MRGVFISDLHAALRLPYARVDAGGISSDRLRDVIDVLRQAGAYAVENGVDHLFILGDLFDQKHPDGATLVTVSRTLTDIARYVKVWILPGNHDAVDRDGRLYTLNFYKELKLTNIHIFGHEAVVIDDVVFHAVPWLPDNRARERIRKAAHETQAGKTNVLLFHQAVIGAVGESGWVTDSGLGQDTFEGFTIALTGHYHMPQEHRWGRYLGSPIHLKFSDEDGTTRGFWDIDFEPKKPKQTLIPTKFPVFGTDEVRLEEGDKVQDLIDVAESAQGLAYLRLKVAGPPSAIEANRAQLLDWRSSAEKFGLRTLKLDLRPDRVTKQRLKMDPTLSLPEMLKRYADAFADGEEPAELTRVASSILERVERD